MTTVAVNMKICIPSTPARSFDTSSRSGFTKDGALVETGVRRPGERVTGVALGAVDGVRVTGVALGAVDGVRVGPSVTLQLLLQRIPSSFRSQPASTHFRVCVRNLFRVRSQSEGTINV